MQEQLEAGTIVTLSPRNQRQNQCGRVIAIVIDRLVRPHRPRRTGDVFASVQVSIESRKVTTRDVQANAMAGFEHVSRRP